MIRLTPVKTQSQALIQVLSNLLFYKQKEEEIIEVDIEIKLKCVNFSYSNLQNIKIKSNSSRLKDPVKIQWVKTAKTTSCESK